MAIELFIIGSNSALFAYDRHQTAQLVTCMDQKFLVDCGEGTQLLLKKYKISSSKINVIFISHLHGDHYFGLMGLISTMHLLGRNKPLTIIGPPGLSDIITIQLKHSKSVFSFQINYIAFSPESTEVVFENKQLTVTTIPMNHSVVCSGFLFREKVQKSKKDLNTIEKKNKENSYQEANKTLSTPLGYAYCSDTKYIPELATLLQNVDLLYHEATFAKKLEHKAVATLHSTTEQAAKLAKAAGVKRLIIGHFSSRYKTLDDLLEEAISVFPSTSLALEGNKYVIE